MVFASLRDGPSNIYEQATDGGSATVLWPSRTVDSPSDVSPDGTSILYFSVWNQAPDLWMLPVPAGEPMPLFIAPFATIWGQYSPDGRRVAYQSIEAGRWENVMRELPAGRVWPISTAGGAYPRWAPDGRHIYYTTPDGMLMAVPIVERDSTVDVGEAVALFRPGIVGGGANVVGRSHQYDVAPDGRFLINIVVNEQDQPPISLVLNWQPR